MNVKEFVQYRKGVLRDEAASFANPPKLCIIQANDNPASDAYIRGKLKDSAELGYLSELWKLPPTASQEELLELIDKANNDPSIDGLIVQLPLPKHIDEETIKKAVNPLKDVDGFHPETTFEPCTPKGICDYLAHEGFPFRGKNAVVLGRSNIVGKPMAHMLLAKDCNVTVLHSKTTPEDRAFYIAHADLIIVAIGRMHFLDSSYKYRDSAYIVDVGINRGEDGKLHGDAEPDLPVKLQTPVPGGVGLLTRLALMENLLIAKKSQ
ncbi:MAG: bifunctional 5,10-methylenetetrahydrofolate dehydrogenase/5,10-methenyltetrahydrofolate cyclohydrolase [Bacilli bacterium]|nr:bifunctional 5,10-methylenetetrahydrofolate dehydrogenase/5,10-methenyltetrahydrofolate cyclohydrolase [Bacilli bacterium]